MAASTGPMLAVGAVTFGNKVLLQRQEPDFRVVIATGIAAGGLALVERASKTLAVGVAWLALVTVLLVRVDPKTPAPVETLLKSWNEGG